MRSCFIDIGRRWRGVGRMSSARPEFTRIVVAILTRYGRQNALILPPSETLADVAERLWQVVEERGLPELLAPSDMGTPGEMSAAEVAPLIRAVLKEDAEAHPFVVPVRQLVKACFHPYFNKCRDSFHELDAEGRCRRQQLDRALTRASGSHCVDCPYWTALTAEQHENCLRDHWHGDEADFTAHKGVFLPEDFRALRVLLRAHSTVAKR